MMKRLSPPETAQSYDNVGLLLGRNNAIVKGVLCALDITDKVIDEAIRLNVDIIISHHPLVFKAIPKITDETRLGRAILRLVENKISVYSAHTDLDAAQNGTNGCLAERLGLSNVMPLLLEDGEKPMFGRTGELVETLTLAEFAKQVAEKIELPVIKYVGDGAANVTKVGLCTGSGASVGYFNQALKAGCNVFVTGDITYHKAQAAAEMGMHLIDATHFATEVIIVERLRKYIEEEAKQLGKIAVYASTVESDIFRYI